MVSRAAGSEDSATAALEARACSLVEVQVSGSGSRSRDPAILRYFISRSDPRLRVLQKENGGRSDAVNAGLNVAHKELVAIVDADTLLERDALNGSRRCSRPTPTMSWRSAAPSESRTER